MKSNKLLFAGAALSGMVLAASAQASGKHAKGTGHAADKPVMAQCDGVNACKGQSKCHTKTTQCAGTNACKGKGWEKMTKTDCEKNKGKWHGKG